MKLSPQGIADFDAVFRYLSDHDLFPKVEREHKGAKVRERVWVEKKAKKEEE